METITLIGNPQYGAAEMIRSYRKNFIRGLEIAIILHVMIFTLYFFVNYFNKLEAGNIKDKPIIKKVYDITQIEIPPSTKDDETKIERIDDFQKPVKDVTALTPDPVARINAEELTVKTQDELDRIVSNVSHEGDTVQLVYNGNNNMVNVDDNTIGHHIEDVIKHDDPNITYQGNEVSVLPECVNLAQVKNSMVYPPLAVQINMEGKVTVKLLVGTDGKVKKIGSISGPEIFYDEVREKSMNLEFTPGLQGDKAVNVWMYVPFNFKLKN